MGFSLNEDLILLMTAISAYGIIIIANKFICQEVKSTKFYSIVPRVWEVYSYVSIIGVLILAGIIGNVIITSKIIIEQEIIIWFFILIALIFPILIFQADYFYNYFSNITESDRRIRRYAFCNLLILTYMFGYFILKQDFAIIFVMLFTMFLKPIFQTYELYLKKKK